MQDADWEEDCASNQEAPKAFCKAGEDVSKPSEPTQKCDNLCHIRKGWNHHQMMGLAVRLSVLLQLVCLHSCHQPSASFPR